MYLLQINDYDKLVQINDYAGSMYLLQINYYAGHVCLVFTSISISTFA